ncbi:hypothetical protein LCGC14_2905120 [marine sediment metagenome]|uniref:Major capsid protein n=1 Tax=marine sediment metagenome TaxID=412755 RepID=A0A0F8XT70_9ZZZZ
MPTFGDTTSGIANFSEVIDIVNQAAEVLELEYAVMGNLVDRREIPRGQDRVRIPYQTETFEAQDYTDGDEIAVTQAMGIDTIDLTTNELQITYRISSRALRFPAIDLAAMAGDEQAKAAAEALEVRLLATTDDSGTQDISASDADTTLAHFRQIRRMFRTISRANGGPVRPPVSIVMSAFAEEDFLTDLGVAADSTNQSRIIPGFLENLISISPSLEDSFLGIVLRMPIFVSQYINQTIGSVTAPNSGAAFQNNAIILGVAKDWDTKPFEEVEWPGAIVRAMTDYGQRLGPFPKRVIQLTTEQQV